MLFYQIFLAHPHKNKNLAKIKSQQAIRDQYSMDLFDQALNHNLRIKAKKITKIDLNVFICFS